MFYSNEDYTVRTETINGVTRYFITYHSKSCKEPQVEITYEFFKLYCNEFRRPYRKHKKNKAKFCSQLNIEDYLTSPKLAEGFLPLVADIEKITLDRVQLYEIRRLLNTCTTTQQRRFRLCIYGDMSYCEAAKLERCDERAIRQSVNAVLKKINIFTNTTSEFKIKSGFNK